MMKTSYYYSFNELLKGASYSGSPYSLDSLKIATLMASYYQGNNTSDMVHTPLPHYLSMFGIDINDLVDWKMDNGVKVINKTPYTQLFTLLKTRFGNHYIEAFDKEFTYGDDEEKLTDFINHFTGVLMFTSDKYVKLLNIYDAQANKLMDGLKSTKEGSSSLDRAHSENGTSSETKTDDYEINAEGKNLHNDTPQDYDVVATIEGDQFVSDLNKSEAKTTNEGSTEIHGTHGTSGEIHDAGSTEEESVMDTQYTMEKIAVIQEKYNMVLLKWANEFEGLFIEEENIL